MYDMEEQMLRKIKQCGKDGFAFRTELSKRQFEALENLRKKGLIVIKHNVKSAENMTFNVATLVADG